MSNLWGQQPPYAASKVGCQVRDWRLQSRSEYKMCFQWRGTMTEIATMMIQVALRTQNYIGSIFPLVSSLNRPGVSDHTL